MSQTRESSRRLSSWVVRKRWEKIRGIESDDEDENDLRRVLTNISPCRFSIFAICAYSAAMCAPFSATERFIKSTRKASATDTAAKIRKQSK